MFFLVAGGTAGHVFPSIALAQELGKVCYLTDIRGSVYLKDTNSIILPIRRLGLKFFLISPYLLFKSLVSLRKAKTVIFFGGYVSLFPFIAARILMKKCVIMQLDSKITRLNRLLIPHAHHTIFAFAQTDLKNYKNTHAIGLPLRNGFEFDFIKKEKDEFKIAIIGGSLGSNYWKELLKNTLEELPYEIRKTITLKIQTQEGTEFLKEYNIKGIETARFYDTQQLFKESHLIIARAGATSIAEISASHRPAYLVPWVKSIENHQYENAKNYAAFGGAKFGTDAKQLANFIKDLMDDQYFEQVCKNAGQAFVQYAKKKIAHFLKQL